MKKIFFFYFLFPFITSCYTLKSQYKKSELSQNREQITPIVIDHFYLKSQANWFYIKAEQESNQGLYSRSIASFKEALIYHPQSFTIHLRLLNEYLQADQNLQALQLNKVLLKQYPNNIDLHLQLGKIYEKNKLYQKALVEYNWILNKNLYHIETLYQKALLHFTNKEYSLARSHLTTLSTIGEKNLHQVHYLLALINKYENHIQKSVLHFKKSINFKPQFLASTLELFYFYQKTAQIDKALYILEEFKKNKGVSPLVSLMLFKIYNQKKNWTKAIQYLQVVLENNPSNLSIQVQLATLWAQKQEYQKAVFIMKDIISKYPRISAKAYILQASFLEKKKDLQGCLEVLIKGSQVFSKNKELLFYKGVIYDQLDKKNQAIQSFKTVLNIDSKHIMALNYLASIYVETNQNLKTAENLVMQALSFSPQDSHILDTAGWIFFKQGKIKLALKYLQQAYKNNKTESLITEHLAEVLHYRI